MSGPADTTAGAPGTRAATLTLALCFLAAMVEGLDIQSAGVAAPRMGPEFALTSEQLGYVLAASPLGLLFGAMLGGRAADLFGRKVSLIASMVAFGVFSIGTALVSGYEPLLVMRLLTGLGLGGALPNLIALAAEASGPGRRNALVSLMAAGMPLGGVAPGLLAVAYPGAADWRMIFYVGGALPIMLAVVLAFALPESERFRQARATAPRQPILPALFAEGRALPTLALGLSFFSAFLILYLLQNWLPILMVGKGFSKPDAGWIQAAFNVGGAVGAVTLGMAMDRGRRKLVLLIAYIGVAAGLWGLGAVTGQLTAACAVGLVAGVFVTGTQLILYGLASGVYATPYRGTGVGFSVALGRLGSVLGPLGAAALVAGGKTAPQVLATLLPVVVLGGLAAIAVTFAKPAKD